MPKTTNKKPYVKPTKSAPKKKVAPKIVEEQTQIPPNVGPEVSTILTSDLKGMKHPQEYIQLIYFTAIHQEARKKLFGVIDQAGLARKFKVNEATLSEWKTRTGFWADVSRLRRDFYADRVGDVVNSLVNTAIRTGAASESKLVLEYSGDLKKEDSANKVSEQLAEAISRIARVLPDRTKK